MSTTQSNHNLINNQSNMKQNNNTNNSNNNMNINNNMNNNVNDNHKLGGFKLSRAPSNNCSSIDPFRQQSPLYSAVAITLQSCSNTSPLNRGCLSSSTSILNNNGHSPIPSSPSMISSAPLTTFSCVNGGEMYNS